jgi:hypothetical protein
MIYQIEEKILEQIDSNIDNASDDELFAGGYLRGHISLAAADCELAGVDDLETFKVKVLQSLAAAKTELTPADQIVVNELWESLVSRV